jgi:hypothetical protein
MTKARLLVWVWDRSGTMMAAAASGPANAISTAIRVETLTGETIVRAPFSGDETVSQETADLLAGWRHLAKSGGGRTVGAMVDTDTIVERILTTYETITVVGASAAPAKAAHSVPAHMQQRGWRIIPVNPHADEILGEPVYRLLADIPEQVGLVDVFRPSAQTADFAR